MWACQYLQTMFTCSGNSRLPSAMLPLHRCNCFHLITSQSCQYICRVTPLTLCQVVFDFLPILQHLFPYSFPGINLLCLCSVSVLPNTTLHSWSSWGSWLHYLPNPPRFGSLLPLFFTVWLSSCVNWALVHLFRCRVTLYEIVPKCLGVILLTYPVHIFFNLP